MMMPDVCVFGCIATPQEGASLRLGAAKVVREAAFKQQKWKTKKYKHMVGLQEGATLRPEAAEVVREVARAARVYIIAHVSDDVGEATVRGACEAGGLVGSSPGQVCGSGDMGFS